MSVWASSPWRWRQAAVEPFAKGPCRAGRFLVLACCLAVAHGAAADCLRLDSAELPRLGGLRGDWLGPSEFVLADMKRGRLLVYTTDGASRTVWPPSGRSWLGPPATSYSLELDGIVATADGPVLAVYELKPGADGTPISAASFVRLDSDLRPSSVLDWQWPVSGQPELRNSPLTFVNEMIAVGGTLYLWGGHMDDPPPRPVLLALDGRSDSGGLSPEGSGQGLRQRGRWPLLEGEGQFLGALPIHSLAAAARHGTEVVYALRMAPKPFIQILVPPENGRIRRLTAFPQSASSLPNLPQIRGQETAAAYFFAAEAADYPAGLYGERDRLYVLTHQMVDGSPVWDLHHVDPQKDEVVGRTRLPTNAAHVSLLPGEKHWVLEESSSYADDIFQQPLRLLLLDAEAIRSGAPLSCD